MDKIQAQFVFEILGRPEEYVTDSLNKLIEVLSRENGVHVLEKITHPPKAIKESKELFTSFAEVTLELDSLNHYFTILFAYLPSHVEIIHPEKMPLTNFEFNNLSNKIALKIHDYDAITKRLMHDKQLVIEKLYSVAPQLFKVDGNNRILVDKEVSVKQPEKQSSLKKTPKAKKSKKSYKK
jgi:hypothetical protein